MQVLILANFNEVEIFAKFRTRKNKCQIDHEYH